VATPWNVISNAGETPGGPSFDGRYLFTVLCSANFVNAKMTKCVEYWTEELDRLGDKIFFGISK
jgi:hypothetical protein